LIMACSLNMPDILFANADMTPGVANANPYDLLFWLEQQRMVAESCESAATQNPDITDSAAFFEGKAKAFQAVIAKMIELSERTT
jgi:hypothetical protein